MSYHDFEPSSIRNEGISPSLPLPKVGEDKETFLPFLQSEKQASQKENSYFRHVTALPTQCLSFFTDDSSMRAIVDLFGVTGQTLLLVGEKSSNKVNPILSILSSPFYLYHAVRNMSARLHLFKEAVKASRVADAFFYLLSGIGSMGAAITDIVKPFVGGMQLSGLMAIREVALVFTLVIPAILIVFGTMGGISETWALTKTRQALKEFNQQKEMLNGDLAPLLSFLEFLQGPLGAKESEEDGVANARARVEENLFKSTFFTNDQRYEATKQRIERFFASHDLHAIRSAREKLASEGVKHFIETLPSKLEEKKKENPEAKEAVELIEQLQKLFGELLDQKRSDIHAVDTTLAFYERLLEVAEKSSIEHPEIIQELLQGKEEIESLRGTLLRKGIDILSLEHSELHRKLLSHAVFLFIAALTLAAGIIFIAFPHYRSIGSALALTSCAIDVLYILFQRIVSQKQFHRMDPFLKEWQTIASQRLNKNV